MMKLIKLLMALVFLGAGTTLLAKQDVSETRSVDADAYVSVSNAVGEITIRGWDRNEVSIEGTLADNVEELVIEETGNGLLVEVKNPRHARRLEDTILVLNVPEGASVEVESVSADINVSGLSGERMSASSVSGDLDLGVNSSMVEVESVSGDVMLQGSSSETSVESVSGEIELIGISGELSIATVSGDVIVDAGELTGARFETVSGDLEISASLSEDARLSAESMSGDVTLTLPSSVSARFEASSFSGDIESEFGDAEVDGPGSSLEFTVGDGSARVRLESFSADIEINSN